MRRFNKKLFSIVFGFCLFLISIEAYAASIVYSPSSKNVAVDSSFSVTVSLTSTNKAVNAFSGTVVFPSDLVTAQSISTTGSIVNFWTIQPVIGDGSIRFEGLVLNPGFTGTSGKLFTVNFSSKSQGTAYISLTGASTLANDGLGTNIFDGVMPKSTIIIGSSAPVSTTPVVTKGVPLAPDVSSSTHPDPSDWFSENTASFSWDIPQDVTDVSYLLDQNPSSTPSVSKGIVSSFVSGELLDGEYYFHIRFRNSNGWGSVAHYRIGIDTKNPLFVSIEPVAGTLDGTLHANIYATDEMSGVESYEISIDAGETIVWTPKQGEKEFVSGVISSGRHLLFVRAIDFAGNSSSGGDYIFVESVPPPEITDYPQTMENGDRLVISGKAVPSSSVMIYFEKEGVGLMEKIFLFGRLKRETYAEKVSVDSSGKFSFEHSAPWHNGNYHITAKTILSNGAESAMSSFVEVSVLPGKFEVMMNEIKKILLPIIPVLLSLIFIGGLLLFIKKSFGKYRKSVIQETDEASSVASESIKIIDEEVLNEIALLKKIRQGEPLSEREQRFLAKLKGDIDTAGSIIQKEIKDIEEKI